MKYSLIITPVIFLAATETSSAANFAALTQAPTLLNMVLLLGAAACFVFCLQVVSLVRGGFLSRGWQLFMAGFGFLALGQALRLLADLEIIVLPGWLVPAAMVLMAAAFLYGLLETKRSLS